MAISWGREVRRHGSEPRRRSGGREDATFTVTVTDTTGQVDKRVLVPPAPPRGRVTALAFGPSEQAVAAVYDDGTAVWWNGDGPPTTAHLDDSPQDRDPYKIVWSRDVIATVGRTSVPQLWDAHTGKLLHELKEHTQPVLDIAFDRSGQHLATVGRDQDVVIWNVSDGQLSHRRAFSDLGTEVAFSPGCVRVYVAARRGAPYVGYLDSTELFGVASKHVSRTISPEECRRYVAPAEPCPGG